VTFLVTAGPTREPIDPVRFISNRSSGRMGFALAAAAAAHLPDWPERVTPHVLRHFCASQLYLGGMDLVAIQETLGHAWVATTMNYIHVHATHVEDAWIAGQQRAAGRLKGLGP